MTLFGKMSVHYHGPWQVEDFNGVFLLSPMPAHCESLMKYFGIELPDYRDIF